MLLQGANVWSGLMSGTADSKSAAQPHTHSINMTTLSVNALDELLLHHTEESNVGQVGDEGFTGPSADALTASEVQQSQRGETLQVGQTTVCKLTAAWVDRQTSSEQRKNSRVERLCIFNRRIGSLQVNLINNYTYKAKLIFLTVCQAVKGHDF